MPQITTNWLDAERMTAALTTSIVDCMALAGSDESETLIHCREAANYAHTLARFLENIADGLAAEMTPKWTGYQPPEIEREAEVAAFGPAAPLRPTVRIGGEGAA